MISLIFWNFAVDFSSKYGIIFRNCSSPMEDQ